MRTELEFEERVEIKHKLKYISPSSLKTYMSCPYKFYLSKLSPVKEKVQRRRDPQSWAAAFGSAFDCMVKAYLAEECDLPKKYDVDNLLRREIKDLNTRNKVRGPAQEAFEVYRETALPVILEEGVVSVDYEPEGKLGIANVFGKVDLVQKTQILDWKCQGFCSSSKSPQPGWCRKWEYNKVEGRHVFINDRHKRADDFLEDINSAWAVQVAVYAFLAGHTPGEELVAAIDNLVMRNVLKPMDFSPEKVKIVQLRLKISPQFQKRIFYSIQEVWARSQCGVFPIPTPNKGRCHAWGSKCEAAEFCPYYKEVFEPDDESDFNRIMRLSRK